MPDHLAFPIRLAGDQLATLAQGGADEITQRVAVVCSTPLAWLDGRPDFGLYDQAFLEGGPDLDEIERQIATHVPEAHALVSVDRSALDQALAIVNVQVGA